MEKSNKWISQKCRFAEYRY